MWNSRLDSNLALVYRPAPEKTKGTEGDPNCASLCTQCVSVGGGDHNANDIGSFERLTAVTVRVSASAISHKAKRIATMVARVAVMLPDASFVVVSKTARFP